MSDQLSVRPDGLFAASVALQEHAGQLLAADEAAPAGGKASETGAARVATAIAAFGTVYASRLCDHGKSSAAAGATYTHVDDDEAAAIGSVSV